MKILGKIEPQPVGQINYIIGNETWLKPDERTPVRLVSENWGNLGCLELNPEILPNKSGMRVKVDYHYAPEGAIGHTKVDGIYYWTDTDCYGRTKEERDVI